MPTMFLYLQSLAKFTVSATSKSSLISAGTATQPIQIASLAAALTGPRFTEHHASFLRRPEASAQSYRTR